MNDLDEFVSKLEQISAVNGCRQKESPIKTVVW